MRDISHVPGPAAWPLLRGTRHILRFLADPIGFTSTLFHTYGRVAALTARVGVNLYATETRCPGNIFVYGPELLRQAALEHEVYEKRPLTGLLYGKKDASPRTFPLNYFLGGLFLANGSEHRRQRRLILPSFHKQQIESYCDLMVNITQERLERIDVGEVHDVVHFFHTLAAQVVASTLFGEDMDTLNGEIMQTLWSVHRLLSTPTLYVMPWDWPGTPFHRLLNNIEHLDRLLRAFIAHKRDQPPQQNDMVSTLIQATDDENGARLSENELLGHISSIFAAGFDTSANALSWTLLLLTQHPAILADLVDELHGVLRGTAPTVEQMSQLPLLDAVIKESLRLFPPAIFNWRVLAQETVMGDYTLPAGTEIYASIYHTHHMPEIYEQPNVFLPCRWETIKPTLFEYQPFSAGARMCPGAAYATLEIKVVLALLLQRYRPLCAPRLKVDRSGLAVLTPKGPLAMTFQRQDRQFKQHISRIQGNVNEMVAFPM